MTEQMDVKIS